MGFPTSSASHNGPQKRPIRIETTMDTTWLNAVQSASPKLDLSDLLRSYSNASSHVTRLGSNNVLV